MNSFNVRFAVIVLAVLLFVAFMPSLAVAQDEAAGAIATAKQQLGAGFESARAAEAAGANISSLTQVLNVAGGLLSASELAYSYGDVAAAQSLASQCSQTLNGFAATSDALRVAADQQGSFDFWAYTVGSVAGTFVVLAMGFAVWLVVKRRVVPVEVESEVQTD